MTKPILHQAGVREGQDRSRVAFQIVMPGSEGSMELRIPEVLRPSAGFLALDNNPARISPNCQWREFPPWPTDTVSERSHHDFKIPDSLHLLMAAMPAVDYRRAQRATV